MYPLLLLLLLECAVGCSADDADEVSTAVCALEAVVGLKQAQDGTVASSPRTEPTPKKVPGDYTLAISRVYGGSYVQFTGTGYYPPEDLGTYQICVHGEREFTRFIDENHETTWTTPWSQCRSIGFVSSDGVVQFSQVISSEAISVCIELRRSFSAVTRGVGSPQSVLGVPLNAWPDRGQALACVRLR